MLKFFCDECVPKPTIDLLRSSGFSVLTTQEAGLSGFVNGDLLRKAVKEGRIFITTDLDFSNILEFPPSSHCGIILLKLSRQVEAEVHNVLTDLLNELKPEEFNKSFIIVDRNKYRIRREE